MSELSFLESALLNPNVQAFLTVIRTTEGTNYHDGANFIFGSREDNDLRNPDLSDHPGTKYAKHYTDNAGHNIITTAAGSFQFIQSTWKGLKDKLGLPDFSEHSQQLGAVELLSEKNCLQRIMDGDFNYALKQAATIWASLPGAGANQPERTLADVTHYYEQAGGTIA